MYHIPPCRLMRWQPSCLVCGSVSGVPPDQVVPSLSPQAPVLLLSSLHDNVILCAPSPKVSELQELLPEPSWSGGFQMIRRTPHPFSFIGQAWIKLLFLRDLAWMSTAIWPWVQSCRRRTEISKGYIEFWTQPAEYIKSWLYSVFSLTSHPCSILHMELLTRLLVWGMTSDLWCT